MDMPLVIRQRMKALGLEQKDLAAGASVTESYISQLLTRKKSPPDPERSDIYGKLERVLKLPKGQLSKLAELQRKEDLKNQLVDPPTPLFKDVRHLILRKCDPGKARQIHAIFQKQPFGELERLVTQKLLDVVKKVVKEELQNEAWLKRVARFSGRSYEEMRVNILEFLDTDVFHVSLENCVSFLDPLIESWDIELNTFGMEIVLNRRLAPEPLKKFEFVEQGPETSFGAERGFKEFLNNASLSGDATQEEIEFLKKLTFQGKRPTRLYYYRELQNLRDPLHFRPATRQREHARR
ncbi:MAG: helix-turn-helix domain-containing protein [Vicinamibacteria bacterium]